MGSTVSGSNVKSYLLDTINNLGKTLSAQIHDVTVNVTLSVLVSENGTRKLEFVRINESNSALRDEVMFHTLRDKNLPSDRVSEYSFYIGYHNHSNSATPQSSCSSCLDYKMEWLHAALEHCRDLIATNLYNSWPTTSVYINDHLTPYNKMILRKARSLVKEKKIAFAWMRDCRILIRKTAGVDSSATVVKCVEDLECLVK
ncbi:hypothetical protein J6590_050450 [Homalodisca vitripennis]|nr:hypothetical protein J6590_050450 [Homalodisca vitripennis]